LHNAPPDDRQRDRHAWRSRHSVREAGKRKHGRDDQKRDAHHPSLRRRSDDFKDCADQPTLPSNAFRELD
jgi:hypothetical protein